MSSNTKHSKIRNTGILFELLTRQITVDVLNNDKNGLAANPFLSLFNTSTVICLVSNSNKMPVLRILECFIFELILNSNQYYNTSYINISILNFC